ncbi:MAG: hypothetical protein WAM28_04010 [Chlamydiales bacterium]
MINPSHDWNTSFKPLIWGSLISLACLLAAYFIVVEQLLVHWVLLTTVIGLGTVQAIVQIVLFLQIGLESKPRWSIMVFLFMLLIIVVLVSGTLWIMHNLDYNVMGH